MNARREDNWLVFMFVAPNRWDDTIADIRFGVTADIAKRVLEIQKDLPQTIEQVCYLRVGSYQEALGMEAKIVKSLRRLVTHGSWIEVDTDSPLHKTAMTAAFNSTFKPKFGEGWKWSVFDMEQLKAVCAKQTLVQASRSKETPKIMGNSAR